MTSVAALALLWAVVLCAIWLSVRAPRSRWGTLRALGVGCLAVAAHFHLTSAVVDKFAVNVSGLLARIFLVAAVLCGQLYVRELKGEQRRDRQGLYVAVAVFTILVLSTAWWFAPLHDVERSTLGGLAQESTWGAVYTIGMYVYVGWFIVELGLWTARMAPALWSHDRPAAVCAVLTSSGCAAGVLVLFGWAAHSFGASWAAGAELFFPVPLLLISSGIAIPLLSALRDRPRRDLSQLWRHLTGHVPGVLLAPSAFLVADRAGWAAQRRTTEIRDALTRIRVARDTPPGVQHVAIALRRPVADGVPAATLLPPTVDTAAETLQLHELATAFRKASR